MSFVTCHSCFLASNSSSSSSDDIPAPPPFILMCGAVFILFLVADRNFLNTAYTLHGHRLTVTCTSQRCCRPDLQNAKLYDVDLASSFGFELRSYASRVFVYVQAVYCNAFTPHLARWHYALNYQQSIIAVFSERRVNRPGNDRSAHPLSLAPATRTSDPALPETCHFSNSRRQMWLFVNAHLKLA